MSERVADIPDPEPPDDAPYWDWAADLAAREDREWDDEARMRGIKSDNKARLLWLIGWIAPVLMVAFTAIFIVGFGFWSWHMLLPPDLHWLSPDQLSKIQSIIFSGAIGAIIATYLRDQVLN